MESRSQPVAVAVPEHGDGQRGREHDQRGHLPGLLQERFPEADGHGHLSVTGGGGVAMTRSSATAARLRGRSGAVPRYGELPGRGGVIRPVSAMTREPLVLDRKRAIGQGG